MEVFIPTREDLEECIEQVFERILEEKIPEIIREATKKEWLTKEELQDVTGWSDRTLQYLRDSRQIPFSQHGRKILYPADGIEEFLREHEVKSQD